MQVRRAHIVSPIILSALLWAALLNAQPESQSGASVSMDAAEDPTRDLAPNGSGDPAGPPQAADPPAQGPRAASSTETETAVGTPPPPSTANTSPGSPAVVQTPELAAGFTPGTLGANSAQSPQQTLDETESVAEEDAETTDHQRVGIFAFGAGTLLEPRVDLSALVVETAPSNQPASTDDSEWIPTLEGRFWLAPNKAWGIDVGLSYFRSDLHFPGETLVRGTGFVGRVGVPFVLTSHRHTTIELIPQLGYVGVSQRSTETRLALFQWDAALRLVAEIHFGFIGLPELSLLSGFGVNYSRQVLYVRSPFNLLDSSSGAFASSTRRLVVSEVVPFGGRGPWDIFVGNLSALYYL